MATIKRRHHRYSSILFVLAIVTGCSSSPDIPDVGKIVFVSDKDFDSALSLNFEIYSINADGSNLINLTNSPGIDNGYGITDE